MDHASESSKISATSCGSEVRGGARGTVILSDLRTEGVMVVEVPGTGGRRRGKVGSSWGFGPDMWGIAGRGLLILLRGPLQDTCDGGSGKSNSSRERVPEPEGMHGEASETTCPSSRAYHDISSSLARSPSGSASANSSAVAELTFGGIDDVLIANGCIRTRCATEVLRSCGGLGLRLRPGHSSSSDVSGVVGMSLLEQADMLVSEGVGERVRARGAVFGRCSRVRPGLAEVVVMVLVLRGGTSLTGEVGLVISMTISKALRRTVWCFCSCFCLLGAGLDASGAVARKKFGSSANSSLP